MNTYKTSKGDRLTKGKIDRNIRFAKEIKLRDFKNDNGFIFCESCGISVGQMDCSHTISVKYAQETGRTELAYDQNNIRILCRSCHNILDSKTNQERELIYKK